MPELLLSLAVFVSPLLIASTGSMMAEMSGRTNMALEGQILIGAFCAALVLASGGGMGAACLVAIIAAGIAAAALCACIERLGTDPIMAGLAANLIAQSGIGALSKTFFGSQGTVRLPERPFRLAWGLGGPLVDLAIAAAVFAMAWIFMSQTRHGLRIRAVGSNLEAARASGARPGLSRVISYALSGMACGLSGALLALRISAWSPGMTFGKGWLALAAMYVGRTNFPGVLVSCLVFSTVETAANLMQGQNSVPQEWSLAFPYLATLAFMAFMPRKPEKNRN